MYLFPSLFNSGLGSLCDMVSDCLPYLIGLGSNGQYLGFWGGWLLVSSKLLKDIFYHGDVDILLVVLPI